MGEWCVDVFQRQSHEILRFPQWCCRRFRVLMEYETLSTGNYTIFEGSETR